MDNGAEVEVVRDRLSPHHAEQVLALWRAHGVLEGAAAQERLRQVVCIVPGEDGRVAGVASVFEAAVPLVGDQRFWVLRSFLPSVEERIADVTRTAFDALASEFDPAAGGPIGLCRLIADRAELERRPEAEWTDPRMVYAGYLPDGRQVRIAYFAGANLAGRLVGG